MIPHMHAPLIILEGPDCVGKTTLGKYLAKELDGVFWHLTASRTLVAAMQDYQQNTLDNAKVNINEIDRAVIIDRHWPSEMIYGQVFRPETVKDFNHKHLSDQINAMNGIYILCWHDDVVIRHRKEEDPDHPYDDDSFTKVCNGYQTFYKNYRALNNNWIDYSIPKWGNNLRDFTSLIRTKHHELCSTC
jgi:thymidylate kinase